MDNMEAVRRPKVLIRTLPLEDANYGGILQAYALQHVLTSLGAEPTTDISRTDRESAVKALLRRVAVRTRLSPKSWIERVRHDDVGQWLAWFVHSRMRVVRLFDLGRDEFDRVCRETDLFLVGSDQVWRPRYADVTSYMFDFVDPQVPRASYAASFGSDDVDVFGEALIANARELLGRFSAVSVRENSAVRICREQFGVAAESHLDPTFLVTAEHYREIADDTGDAFPYVATYVLDATPALDSELREVFEEIGVPARSLSHTSSADQGRLASASALSVPQWLGVIQSAQFVVTDSFHGTVFAIINHIPFVTITNHSRGAARFQSLLGLLGLQDRLVGSNGLDAREVVDVLKTSVNWSAVDGIIVGERERAMAYLQNLLDHVTVRVE